MFQCISSNLLINRGEIKETIYIHKIKSPDEWAIAQQACKDESIVSLFISPTATYIALYFYLSSNVKRKNQYTDFLYIYIHIYIYFFFLVFLFCFLFFVRSKDHVPCVIGLRIIRIIELTRRILVGVSTWTSTDTCSTTSMSRPIKVVQIGVNPVAHILCEITRRATVLIFGTFEDWRRGWSRWRCW